VVGHFMTRHNRRILKSLSRRESEGFFGAFRNSGFFLRPLHTATMRFVNKPEIFAQRRKRFIEQLDGAVAVLPSAPVSIRSNDVEFVYRQDSDFYYLTGFAEPESVALFAPGNQDGEYVLFVRPRDKERETWTGRRAGIEGAMVDYAADKAYVLDELDKVIPRYLDAAEKIYYPLGINESMNARMLAW